jgi:hypothetical protein
VKPRRAQLFMHVPLQCSHPVMALQLAGVFRFVAFLHVLCNTLGAGPYTGTKSLLELRFSVGVTGHHEILEMEGQFTQGSSSGRTFGESVGGMFEMSRSDWSNGVRCHTLDTRSDTEFNV